MKKICCFRYLKTVRNNNNNAKETQERPVPRKSRKSKPKRNIKHNLESEDSSDHCTTINCPEDPWREVSVSSVESETEVEKSEVDLSRVKHEIIDTDDDKSKHLNKGE